MKNFDFDNQKLVNIINSIKDFYTILTPDTKEQLMKLTQT